LFLSSYRFVWCEGLNVLNERILIIDDEPNVRLMMQLALQHVGYSVQTATDGPSGLEQYGDGSSFDLVIVDQRMPGMTGTEVLEKLFAANDSAKVILATAFGTIELALEAIQAGAQDFLRKPFTADTLRGAVRTALDRPTEHHTAVPVGLVCKSFTRATINGFEFHPEEEVVNENSGEIHLTYKVHRGATKKLVTLEIPLLFQELVKAHSDLDEVPGGLSFWQGLAEEFLANHLWTTSELPESDKLRIDELTASLKTWIDSVLTVELAKSPA
jgi:DNA-binding response OmpR family regulator